MTASGMMALLKVTVGSQTRAVSSSSYSAQILTKPVPVIVRGRLPELVDWQIADGSNEVTAKSKLSSQITTRA
jgi:hypothetical protein